MKAVRLRTEYLKDPMGIDILVPRFYWQCEGGIRQTAYQIIAKRNGQTVWNSGKVESSAMTHIQYAGESLLSRDRVYWSVKLWDENGIGGEIASAWFEMGLLDTADWKAKWISAGTKPKKNEPRYVDCFRKSFSCGEIRKARLYATACGIYEVQINGHKVGTDVLTPGATDANKRVQYQTYDVTELVNRGENTITTELAGGWLYTHKWGNEYDDTFGSETKLLLQLELTDKAGNRTVIGTEKSWDWSHDGPVRFADNKGGEVVDAIRKPSYNGKARETAHKVIPTASNNVPIRERERFKPVLLETPSGKRVLDYGQNIAGFVEFTVNARAGQTVTLHMGELLENGEFTQANINPVMVGKKSSIDPFQKILYTCHEGENYYKTRFAIFGFQYVLVETDVDFRAEDFTAIAVYSNMEDSLAFDSSHELLNRFVECTRWSGKNNSADVPTDCPQRERAGWTGDAQIFYQTATYFFDYAAFGRKYILDMMDAQWRSGSFTQMAPRPKMGIYMRVLDGSVGWSDAGVYIPYRMWKTYGDDSLLREKYDAMAKYAAFMISRCGKAPLFKKKVPISRENQKYLVMKGMSYGEWIEPKELVDFNVMEIANPHIEESTAYTALTMGYMTEIAAHLGKTEDAVRYMEYAQGCKRAYQELVNLPEYSMDTDRQAKLVRPLYMELLNDGQKVYAQKRLIQALDHFRWRVGTGFLSTPFLLYVLQDMDLAYAYKLLENEEIPGWLSMPKNGATTIWESWEGIQGSPVESLNHYSKGAVCQWIFSELCGVKICGENTFTVVPKPGGSLTHAYMKWDSIYGTVVSRWERIDGKTKYHIEIPANTTAMLRLPGIEKELHSGTYDFEIKEGEHG